MYRVEMEQVDPIMQQAALEASQILTVYSKCTLCRAALNCNLLLQEKRLRYSRPRLPEESTALWTNPVTLALSQLQGETLDEVDLLADLNACVHTLMKIITTFCSITPVGLLLIEWSDREEDVCGRIQAWCKATHPTAHWWDGWTQPIPCSGLQGKCHIGFVDTASWDRRMEELVCVPYPVQLVLTSTAESVHETSQWPRAGTVHVIEQYGDEIQVMLNASDWKSTLQDKSVPEFTQRLFRKGGKSEFNSKLLPRQDHYKLLQCFPHLPVSIGGA